MNAPATLATTEVRVSVIGAPMLAAESIARAIAAAGYRIARTISNTPELQGFEKDLRAGDVVVIIDGEIPAVAVGAELRRRVAGLRTLVVSNEISAADSMNEIRISPSADTRHLISAINALSPCPIPTTSLTSRHLEILQLIAGGLSTEEVGEKLGIASKTVNNHLSAVYRRLRARNLTQAVLRAVRAGLIEIC